MSSEAPRAPYVVFLDLEITRRKRFHVILDADEEDVFKSRLAGELFDWLRDQGEPEYSVETETARYAFAVRTLLTK